MIDPFKKTGKGIFPNDYVKTHQEDAGLKTIFPLSIILIANVFFIYLEFIKGDSHFYQENNLLENLQAILLGISCIIFITYSVFLEKRSSLVLLSFALLCLTFFLREVSVEDLDIPELLIYLGSGTLRHIILISLWALITLYMALDFHNMKTLAVHYLLSRSGILLLICAILLFASDIFERWFREAMHSDFFEELLEFNAYYFLFWSALFSRSSLLDIKTLINKEL